MFSESKFRLRSKTLYMRAGRHVMGPLAPAPPSPPLPHRRACVQRASWRVEIVVLGTIHVDGSVLNDGKEE